MSVSAGELRQARSYLRGKAKAGSKDIPPRRFAAASKEMGIGYKELLALIARLQSGGQGASQRREELLRDAVKSGR